MARRRAAAPPPPEVPPASERAREDLAPESLAADPHFLAFIEAQGGAGLDPLSVEGLELQAQYIKQVGDHPFDVLKTLMRNIFVKPSDRIGAARTLLEYGARKVPAQLEVSGAGGGPLKLDASALAKLNDKELDVLQRLLEKAQKP